MPRWQAREVVLALGLALAGAAAWWLLQRSAEPETAGPPRERLPDYVVSELTALETDSFGRPARILSARELRQYVDENLAELDLPRLTVYRDDGPPWEAEARRGLVLAGGEEIRLREDVVVRRAAAADARPVRLATAELDIWPEREFARGDAPVRIESAGDWLTAAGVRLWYTDPARAEFPGRARLFIVPGKAQGAAGAAPPS